jgi:hypothetical protein
MFKYFIGVIWFFLPDRRRTKGRRTIAMSDTKSGLDRVEEKVLTCEVSDQALETAGGKGKDKAGNYTLGFCTGMAVCPT